MTARQLVDSGRDITPEHTKRHTETGIDSEIHAAYNYVDSVMNTCDQENPHAWYGWALREAFLAGITYAKNNPEQS